MEQSPKNVTVLDGKDATIVCRAVGAPLPNITWTFGNGKIYYKIHLNLEHLLSWFIISRRFIACRAIKPYSNIGIGRFINFECT